MELIFGSMLASVTATRRPLIGSKIVPACFYGLNLYWSVTFSGYVDALDLSVSGSGTLGLEDKMALSDEGEHDLRRPLTLFL